MSYKSAHLEDVASEKTVTADHLVVHRHPLATLEVRKILIEHLKQVDLLARGPQNGAGPVLPAAGVPLPIAPANITQPAGQPAAGFPVPLGAPQSFSGMR